MTISELKELFIGSYVMGNSIEDVVSNLKEPFQKQEYSLKNSKKREIVID